jgi:hypothetical protein
MLPSSCLFNWFAMLSLALVDRPRSRGASCSSCGCCCACFGRGAGTFWVVSEAGLVFCDPVAARVSGVGGDGLADGDVGATTASVAAGGGLIRPGPGTGPGSAAAEAGFAACDPGAASIQPRDLLAGSFGLVGVTGACAQAGAAAARRPASANVFK